MRNVKSNWGRTMSLEAEEFGGRGAGETGKPFSAAAHRLRFESQWRRGEPSHPVEIPWNMPEAMKPKDGEGF